MRPHCRPPLYPSAPFPACYTTTALCLTSLRPLRAALDPPTRGPRGEKLRGPRRAPSPYPVNVMRNAAAEPWQRAWDPSAPWAHRQWTRVDPGGDLLPRSTPDGEAGSPGGDASGMPWPHTPWRPPLVPPPPPLNSTLLSWPRYCPGGTGGEPAEDAGSTAAAQRRAAAASAAGLWGPSSPQPWLLVLDVDSLVSVSAEAARRVVADAMGSAAAAHADAAVAAARVAFLQRGRGANMSSNGSSRDGGIRGPTFDEAAVRLHARWDLGNVVLVLGAVAVAQRRAWGDWVCVLGGRGVHRIPSPLALQLPLGGSPRTTNAPSPRPRPLPAPTLPPFLRSVCSRIRPPLRTRAAASMTAIGPQLRPYRRPPELLRALPLLPTPPLSPPMSRPSQLLRMVGLLPLWPPMRGLRS